MKNKVFIFLGAISILLILFSCMDQSESYNVKVAEFPETKMINVTDTLHGDVLKDPFRWLEDQKAKDTRNWIAKQNAFTDSVLNQIPVGDRLTEQFNDILKIEHVTTPRKEGKRYFYRKKREKDELFILYYRDSLQGEEKTLIDPHQLSDDYSISIEYGDISSDGSLIAYLLRHGGEDAVEVQFYDLEKGMALEDKLPRAVYFNMEITNNKEGLYYTVYGDPPLIKYHRFGTATTEDKMVFNKKLTQRNIPVVDLSDDDKHLLVSVLQGSSGPVSLFLKDLGDGKVTTIIDDNKTRSFATFGGDHIFIQTNLDAPNWKIVKTNPGSPEVSNWETVIAEHETDIIDSYLPVGGKIICHYLDNAQSKLLVFDTEGERVKEIELEALGSVNALSGGWSSDELFINFSSLIIPSTKYHFRITEDRPVVWFRPDIDLNTSDYVIKMVKVPSKDQTEIPVFVTYHKKMALDGNNPLVLNGYGGFGVNMTPYYAAYANIVVKNGGIYARAVLRGGGEFGEKWHQSGMLENKQNVFDDFISASEYFIENNYTDNDHLCIMGGSNGGLLVGAVMVQRPELFKSVVCFYPLLDMIRYHKFLMGPFWVSEYGSSDNPEQYNILKKYSPYHNVRDDVNYPAILFVTGDGDTRVAPLHARKMTAMLQSVDAQENPVLLRYHEILGHVSGGAISQSIEEMVDVMEFVAWQTGMEIKKE